MKKYKQRLVAFCIAIFGIILSCLFCNDSLQVSALTAKNYINTREDFVNAIANKSSVIYVDDINFENNEIIKIDYSVKIIGKKEKTTLSEAHISIIGSNNFEDSISVEIFNIKFDRKFDRSTVDLNQDKSFSQMFSEIGGVRTNTEDSGYRAITVSGYYNLKIDNCEFYSYATNCGPTIYRNKANGEAVLSSSTNICISNCKFYNNICEVGTIWLNDTSLNANILNCEFYNNFARTTVGILFSNGKALFDNIYIHDNQYVQFSSIESQNNLPYRYGGGLFFGQSNATLKNSTIKDCVSQNGGAVAIVNSNVNIDNCKILNNKAILAQNVDEKYFARFPYMKGGFGGAIFANNQSTNGVYVRNSNISNNSAISGAFAGINSNSSGKVNLEFCNIGLNTLLYNEEQNTSLSDLISIKACLIVDDSLVYDKENSYNFISTIEQALANNVITQDIIDNINQNGIDFIENESTNIIVPLKVVQGWGEYYSNCSRDMRIGINNIEFKAGNNTLKITLFIVIPLLFTISLALTIILAKRHKLKTEKEKLEKSRISTTIDVNKQLTEVQINSVVDKYSKVFSVRELEVLKLALLGKSRKEMAGELYITEHTIKKHLANIYSKLEVGGRKELVEKLSQE